MQSGLIRELLADDPTVEIVDVDARDLEATSADAVIGSSDALGRRQVRDLLERRPRLRALVMRGDLYDASLFLLKPHTEHFGDISKAVLRRVVAREPWPGLEPLT
jgi:hypothetical protein